MTSGFTKNVAITIFSRGFYIILGLIFSILVARIFGPEGKGVIALMNTTLTFALMIFSLGLANALTYFVAKDLKQSKNLAFNSIVWGLFFGIIGAFVLFSISKIYPSLFNGLEPRFLYITIIAIPIAIIGQFLYNILLGQERILAINITQILGQALMVAGGVASIFIFKRGLFLTSLFPILFSPLLVFLIYYFLIFKKQGNFSFNPTLIKQPLNYGFKFFIATILATAVLKSDIYLVNIFLNLKQLGFYSIASSFADYLSLIPILIGTILFPRATALGEEAKEFIKKVSRVTFGLMIILSVAAAILAKPFILLLYGQAFLPAFLPFILLIPGMFFWSLSIIYNNYFASRNLLNISIVSGLIGFLLNLILNLIYIPKFGIIAAAITSSLAYLVVFLLNILYLNKKCLFNLGELILIKKEDFKAILNNLKING